MKSLLALAILTGSVLYPTIALSQQTYSIDLPFSFMVKGQSFPAGYYSVRRGLNDTLIDLTSKLDPTKHIAAAATPADPRHDFVALSFAADGSTYSLATIQCGRLLAKF